MGALDDSAGAPGTHAGTQVTEVGHESDARRVRGPIDPRLLRYARSARPHLVVSVLIALVITGTIVVMAVLLARVLAGVITDPARRDFGSWTTELVVLGVVVAVRGVASWWQARLAHRAGSAVVAELENSVLRAGAQLRPRELDARRTELAVVVGNGLDGLRGWFTGYLPALLLACLVPPIVLVVIAFHDPTSALIAVVTVPLIPLFMVLIGLLTQGRAKATLAASTRLSDQILDLFAGMPTLRALGREGPGVSGMAKQVAALGDSLRQRTMQSLRMAFLSSMVLEGLATLSVALIAVAIGLRLVFGEMTLYAGLVALILAPEVYWPLRQVGEKFHAAQDGMAAGERAFAVLDSVGARQRSPSVGQPSVSADGGAVRVDPVSADSCAVQVERPAGAVESGGGPSGSRIHLRDLTVAARSGTAPHRLSAELMPGAVTVLTGPNGCGKSTTLQAILGLIEPDSGAVLIDGTDVRDLDDDDRWARVAWLPQRPVLVPGTLRENIELLGAPGTAADLDRLEQTSAATGFDGVLDELPQRWDTVLGQGGTGLSLGQRQRLALTRTLAAHRPILLLDEPTAHLDATSEQRVLTTLRALAAEGATVVVVAHRPTILAAADVVVEVVGVGAGRPSATTAQEWAHVCDR
ncbi:thiol reductant ABC exporter subunit CydD [Nocardia caishijiensis]|uniref:ATP-binding cassette subfamily C protein CydD n=1 Tax=Nocardia caishijiensis TaxID=184756 RepID=A0ABQ6YQF8_9NOCA|nr:thiol reductant ABC exporter subunit CydD [Nocardia caishijiensis]KAF0848005.1 ATP-binding cassette subfamily C protein CydD [Nocardia caishijiensis]